MAETPNGSNAVKIDELEATLTRIPSVTAARVVSDHGRIAEVHVLADRDRAPKQVVRDIQSVALAQHGVEVDYRTISVVQLEDGAVETSSSPQHRVVLADLRSVRQGHAVEVHVRLRAGSDEVVGVGRGPLSALARAVARAVVDASAAWISNLAVEVEYADAVDAAHHQLALVVLRLATDRGERIVSGCAIVQQDSADAVARAALSALNRLIVRR